MPDNESTVCKSQRLLGSVMDGITGVSENDRMEEGRRVKIERR